MGFQNVELKEIEDNPFREKSAYIYDEDKINELAESMADTSYWENMLARKTKSGRIQLAYGHHRLQALKKLVGEGLTEYKNIRLNVRPERELTDERMLKIFVQENKDTWGEIPQNLCMSVLQLQAHLTGILDASKDKDEFLKRIGDVGALKIDDRAFTRAKNNGVGATMISQFLGDTWSRQTISDALQVINDDEATFKLAQNLPSVTLANRFQKLVTLHPKTKKKDAVMAEEEVQRKVQDQILKHGLTRADVENAIKMSKTVGEPNPLGAILNVEKGKRSGKKLQEKRHQREDQRLKSQLKRSRLSSMRSSKPFARKKSMFGVKRMTWRPLKLVWNCCGKLSTKLLKKLQTLTVMWPMR